MKAAQVTRLFFAPPGSESDVPGMEAIGVGGAESQGRGPTARAEGPAGLGTPVPSVPAAFERGYEQTPTPQVNGVVSVCFPGFRRWNRGKSLILGMGSDQPSG